MVTVSKECESISGIHIVVPPHFPRKWDIPPILFL